METQFSLSEGEALQRALSGPAILSREAYSELTNDREGNTMLADLRTPAASGKAPIAEAVNIPVSDILDDTNLTALQNADRVFLCGESISQCNAVWFLLEQLGCKDVRIIDTNDELAQGTATETALHNFAEMFNNARDKHNQELEAGKPKPVEKKVILPARKPAQKKVEAEEGC